MDVKKIFFLILISIVFITSCNENFKNRHIHEFIEATCEVAKKCLECGETEGFSLEHTWIDATCEMAKHCSVCLKTEGEALDHTWIDATCEMAKHCSVCLKTEGEALNHTWIDATCEMAKHCSVCLKTEGEALNHTWIDATYELPKMCTLCNTTEGTKLFYDIEKIEYKIKENNKYLVVTELKWSSLADYIEIKGVLDNDEVVILDLSDCILNRVNNENNNNVLQITYNGVSVATEISVVHNIGYTDKLIVSLPYKLIYNDYYSFCVARDSNEENQIVLDMTEWEQIQYNEYSRIGYQFPFTGPYSDDPTDYEIVQSTGLYRNYTCLSPDSMHLNVYVMPTKIIENGLADIILNSTNSKMFSSMEIENYTLPNGTKTWEQSICRINKFSATKDDYLDLIKLLDLSGYQKNDSFEPVDLSENNIAYTWYKYNETFDMVITYSYDARFDGTNESMIMSFYIIEK